jgi:protein SCO1/2
MYNGRIMKNRVLLSALFVIVCVALGAGVGIYTTRYHNPGGEIKPDIAGFLWPNPRVIQPFDVVDQNGNPFGLENLTGKWSFLFFGFTHCPDICPITLSLLTQVEEKITTDNLQIIFVSVDPKRDTPEQVMEYVHYFSKDMIGLTGTDEQIAGLARQIGVLYVENEETAPGDYFVDHSASVFLISPSGQWVGIFTAPHEVNDIVNRFNAISDYINKQG